MDRSLVACSVMLLAVTLCGEGLAQPAPAPPSPPPGAEPAPTPVETPPAPGAAQGPDGAAKAGARSPLDVPPTPAAPGEAPSASPPPPPPLPRSFSNESTGAARSEEGPVLAGWHGKFFLRDKDDQFRLYPGGQLQVDLQSWFGTGVDGDAREAGGAGLPPRFVLRRARMELAGELLKRWSFLFQIEAGLPGSAGVQDVPAGSVAPAEPRVGLGNAFLDYDLCDCFHLTVGQTWAPVSMENRTVDSALTLRDRNIATRGLIAPGLRETGLLAWGHLFDSALGYELMVAGGDGNNRPQVDGSFDFMGRVVVKPLGSVKFLKDVHLGVSARHGDRDQFGVGYDAYSIVTGQGLVLWAPTYEDSLARRIHIIPSGPQNQIGGELRAPLGPVDLRAELHYVANGTREAVEDFELSPTNAERLGLISGWGTYGSVTWWALGDEYVSAAPGVKPITIDFKKKPELKRGLALSAVVAAIVADYDGNQRGGEDDPATPGSEEEPRSSLDVLQLGGDVSYWHTRHARLSLEYSAYVTGGAEADGGLTRVPGNLVATADASARAVHELGSRIQLAF